MASVNPNCFGSVTSSEMFRDVSGGVVRDWSVATGSWPAAKRPGSAPRGACSEVIKVGVVSGNLDVEVIPIVPSAFSADRGALMVVMVAAVFDG